MVAEECRRRNHQVLLFLGGNDGSGQHRFLLAPKNDNFHSFDRFVSSHCPERFALFANGLANSLRSLLKLLEILSSSLDIWTTVVAPSNAARAINKIGLFEPIGTVCFRLEVVKIPVVYVMREQGLNGPDFVLQQTLF